MVSFMLHLSITFFKKYKVNKVISPSYRAGLAGPLLGKGQSFAESQTEVQTTRTHPGDGLGW